MIWNAPKRMNYGAKMITFITAPKQTGNCGGPRKQTVPVTDATRRRKYISVPCPMNLSIPPRVQTETLSVQKISFLSALAIKYGFKPNPAMEKAALPTQNAINS